MEIILTIAGLSNFCVAGGYTDQWRPHNQQAALVQATAPCTAVWRPNFTIIPQPAGFPTAPCHICISGLPQPCSCNARTAKVRKGSGSWRREMEPRDSSCCCSQKQWGMGNGWELRPCKLIPCGPYAAHGP